MSQTEDRIELSHRPLQAITRGSDAQRIGEVNTFVKVDGRPLFKIIEWYGNFFVVGLDGRMKDFVQTTPALHKTFRTYDAARQAIVEVLPALPQLR